VFSENAFVLGKLFSENAFEEFLYAKKLYFFLFLFKLKTLFLFKLKTFISLFKKNFILK
jgi:hypothetical protein